MVDQGSWGELTSGLVVDEGKRCCDDWWGWLRVTWLMFWWVWIDILMMLGMLLSMISLVKKDTSKCLKNVWIFRHFTKKCLKNVWIHVFSLNFGVFLWKNEFRLFSEKIYFSDTKNVWKKIWKMSEKCLKIHSEKKKSIQTSKTLFF